MVFSKSFLSFSQDENEVKKLSKNNNVDKIITKVLFELTKDDSVGYNLSTH